MPHPLSVSEPSRSTSPLRACTRSERSVSARLSVFDAKPLSLFKREIDSLLRNHGRIISQGLVANRRSSAICNALSLSALRFSQGLDALFDGLEGALHSFAFVLAIVELAK